VAKRQQLLGQLEAQRGGRRRTPPPPPESSSPRYPPEVKAKAYAAFLDGSSWADCARAIGHPDPNGTGTQLIARWADEDHWQRPAGAGDYKAKVESERAADPQRISTEIDKLCIKMQKVSEDYIEQFFVEDEETGIAKVVITSAFKTRDFADMAAALRMIHETRIKIRKANEPKDGGSDGKKNDFLSIIRQAGMDRLRDNRRRASTFPATEDDDESESPEPAAEEAYGAPAEIHSIAAIRARVESSAREGGPEAEPVAPDPGPDGE
jgi:hypothetical protein